MSESTIELKHRLRQLAAEASEIEKVRRALADVRDELLADNRRLDRRLERAIEEQTELAERIEDSRDRLRQLEAELEEIEFETALVERARARRASEFEQQLREAREIERELSTGRGIAAARSQLATLGESLARINNKLGAARDDG